MGCAICIWRGEKAHRREERTAQVLSWGEEGGNLARWWTTLSRKPGQGHTAEFAKERACKERIFAQSTHPPPFPTARSPNEACGTFQMSSSLRGRKDKGCP